MKDYYDRDYKLIRSKSYLVWGLIMAALALVMIIMAVLTLGDDKSIALAVTGFGAAVVDNRCCCVHKGLLQGQPSGNQGKGKGNCRNG